MMTRTMTEVSQTVAQRTIAMLTQATMARVMAATRVVVRASRMVAMVVAGGTRMVKAAVRRRVAVYLAAVHRVIVLHATGACCHSITQQRYQEPSTHLPYMNVPIRLCT